MILPACCILHGTDFGLYAVSLAGGLVYTGWFTVAVFILIRGCRKKLVPSDILSTTFIACSSHVQIYIVGDCSAFNPLTPCLPLNSDARTFSEIESRQQDSSVSMLLLFFSFVLSYLYFFFKNRS